MEVKKSETSSSWKSLPRWAIDWDAASYEWTNELIRRMNELVPLITSEHDKQKTMFELDIGGVKHKISISVKNASRCAQNELLFIIGFLNKYPADDPRCGSCVTYRYHSTMEFSELANLAYDLPNGKDNGYTTADCPGSLVGMPYGDYIMRIVDQMNVALGVKFCTLINSFKYNISHLLRFRCTYYNKFGYYGQYRNIYMEHCLQYTESIVLNDVDNYNGALKDFAKRGHDGTMNEADENIKLYGDKYYQYHIKPYGDNLVRFIPAVINDNNITPARFEVYPSPKGSSNLINRLADTIGSLFISFGPPKQIILYTVSNNVDDWFSSPVAVVLSTKTCDVCGVENTFNATECSFCGVGFPVV